MQQNRSIKTATQKRLLIHAFWASTLALPEGNKPSKKNHQMSAGPYQR
jgi:hypothetical protein